jgi:hypothetical protein
MTAVLTPTAPLWPDVATRPDEAAARRALMAQIGRLDAELAVQRAPVVHPSFAETLGAPVEERRPRALAAPRLLSLGELEAARDELTRRLADQRASQDALGARQQGARALREEMLLDPAAHPYVRVSNAEIGEPGCLDWHVRPRFGMLGRLMRWWRVRISSGCP